MIPKAQTIEAKFLKWDYVKLKSFLTGKEKINEINKMKGSLQNGRKFLYTMHSPPYLCVLHLQIQPTSDQKSLKKIPESSKKQNLNLSHAGNYLHSIYIV